MVWVDERQIALDREGERPREADEPEDHEKPAERAVRERARREDEVVGLVELRRAVGHVVGCRVGHGTLLGRRPPGLERVECRRRLGDVGPACRRLRRRVRLPLSGGAKPKIQPAMRLSAAANVSGRLIIAMCAASTSTSSAPTRSAKVA